jgi:hypothetical protein
MRSFAHTLNPFNASAGSRPAIAQPVTFESMRRAKKYAEGKVSVQLFTAQFPEDRNCVPVDFTATKDLDRSILDLANFSSRRKLPLLNDILTRLYESTDAEYLIYTNHDIALMPGFYVMCDHFASKGYDAFAINRRRIPARFNSVDQLEEMYAEAGETHTGYDTLVFKRSLFPRFIMENVVIGIPFGDTTLIHNLYAHAENFRLFTEKHLTFHIGMELVPKWGDHDQYKFNSREFHKALKKLYPLFRIENFPGASLPFLKRHFKWLMNPTFHYPTMLKLDFSQLGNKRRKYPEDERKKEKWLNWIIRRVNFPDEES